MPEPDLKNWREKFPLPLSLIIEREWKEWDGPSVVAVDIAPEETATGNISSFRLANLPVSVDGCSYGDDEEEDKAFDDQMIAYARLFKSSGNMLRGWRRVRLITRQNLPPSEQLALIRDIAIEMIKEAGFDGWYCNCPTSLAGGDICSADMASCPFCGATRPTQKEQEATNGQPA